MLSKVMENTEADRRRAALRAFMDERDLKPRPWAERARISPNVLLNFLNGHSNSLSQRSLEKLAVSERVTISDIVGDAAVTTTVPLTRVSVIGEVQAGTWKTALQWPKSEQYEITVNQSKVPIGRRYGLVVCGTSMNLLYPDGTILVCVPLVEFHRELFSGDKVIVERIDGDVVEATVKELGQDNQGRLWLWPRSNDPEHQAPILAPVDRDENQDLGIRIVGVVVQSVRDELG